MTFHSPKIPEFEEMWLARLRKELSFKQTIVSLVTLMLALISGAWTFEGAYLSNLRVGGQSFSTVASAGLLAIGITSGIMTAWWVMLSVIPTLGSPRRIVAGLVLILSLQGWMFAVSSLNNIIAQTAPAALSNHMQLVLEGYEDAVGASINQALKIKPQLGGLLGESEGRCAQAISEREIGSMTGAAGDGAITGILEMLCIQSTSVAEMLEESIHETEQRSGEANRLLREMERTIHDHERDIFAREAAFRGLVNELRAWLRLSDASDLTFALETAHRTMAAGIAPPSLSSGQFGARQRELIEGLRASVAQTGDVYQEMIADVRVGAMSATAKLEISLPEAVWRSRMDNLPQIAAAIGIDLFQLFMALAFLLAGADRSRST